MNKKELSNQVIALENVGYKKILFQLPILEECSDKTYVPCNPSICKFKMDIW